MIFLMGKSHGKVPNCILRILSQDATVIIASVNLLACACIVRYQGVGLPLNLPCPKCLGLHLGPQTPEYFPRLL